MKQFAEKKPVFNAWSKFQEEQTTSANPFPRRNRLFRTRSHWSCQEVGDGKSMKKHEKDLQKELDNLSRLLKRIVKGDLGQKPYKIQRRQLLPSGSKQKWFGRKCWMRLSVLQTKSSLGWMRSFSLWKLWPTNKTLGFTPLQPKTFPKLSVHISNNKK